MNPLKTVRLARKQSLASVAAAVGITNSNLSRIENGKQSPRPEVAERLAKHFGGAITELQILYPERFNR